MIINTLNLEPLDFSPSAKLKLQAIGNYKEYSSTENLNRDSIDLIVTRLAFKLDRDFLQRFNSLKFILTATTGIDHVDVNYCTERGIKVFNLKQHKEFIQTITTTPEHTLGLVLSIVRNIPTAYVDVTKGNWNRDNFKGFQISGKKAGIIGLGRVGEKLSTYFKALGMKVGYFDPYVEPKNKNIKRYDSLQEMFKSCNIICICVHLTQKTKGMINKELIRLLPHPSFIINTSRGGIINEEDIVFGLKQNYISGFASDVIIGEPDNIQESQIWKGMKDGLNIILTPHIAGASIEVMQKCEDYLVRYFCETIK